MFPIRDNGRVCRSIEKFSPTAKWFQWGVAFCRFLAYPEEHSPDPDAIHHIGIFCILFCIGFFWANGLTFLWKAISKSRDSSRS